MDPSSVCAQAAPEPATVALCLALRERDPGRVAEVARHFAGSGSPTRAAELLDEALSMCGRPSSLPGIGGRENIIAFALAEIAAVRAKLGHWDEASRIADRIETGLESPYGALARAQAHDAIAVELAEAGQFERALELAKDTRACRWITVLRRRECVSDNTAQVHALTEISLRAAKAEKVDWARNAIETIADRTQRRRALVALSLVLARQDWLEAAARGLLGEADSGATDDPALLVQVAGAWRQLQNEALGRKYLEQAVRAATSHAGDAAYGWLAIGVAEECFAYGLDGQAVILLERAFAVVKAARYEAVREQLDLLRAIAGATARGGRFERAREMARDMHDEDYGDEALAEVAKAYADAGQLETAFTFAQTIAYPDHRVRALSSVAGAYAAAGKRDRAAAALNLALATLLKSDNQVPLLLELEGRFQAARLVPDAAAQQSLRQLAHTQSARMGTDRSG